MKEYVFAPSNTTGGNGALSGILSAFSPGSMAPRAGGLPDSVAPMRNIIKDNGMAMSMGDPRKAVPPTKIPNAYRGQMVGRGALQDIPEPGAEEWRI